MQRRSPIFYNALLLTGVNLLLRLVSTSFQVYISAQLGAAGVGLLQLVLSVGGMALTAGMAGIRTGTMYLTAEELGKNRPQNVGYTLRCCSIYSLLCSGCVAMLLLCLSSPIAGRWIGDSRTIPALRLLAAFLPVSCMVGVMTGYFTAAGRIKTLAAVEVAEQLFSMTVTILSLGFWAQSDAGKACQCVVFGSGAGSVLTLCLLLWLRHREAQAKSQPFYVRKRLLQTAVPLAIADDLKAGINTTENLMVPKRLALYPHAIDPLAAFGTVCGMVFPILMFPAAVLFGLCELLIPEMARCNAAGSYLRIQYLAKRSLRVSMFYGCFFCGILYLCAGQLCDKIYGSADAGRHLALYAMLAPMLYCDAVTDAINKGLGQQHICVKYNIFTSLMDIAGLFILLPRLGMTGYFISFLISHLVNFLLSLRLLLKTAKLKLPVFPALLTAIITGIAILGSSLVTGGVWAAGTFSFLYFCLLWITGIVGKEDIFWLKGLVKGK